jgi:hypothetical protein
MVFLKHTNSMNSGRKEAINMVINRIIMDIVVLEK